MNKNNLINLSKLIHYYDYIQESISEASPRVQSNLNSVLTSKSAERQDSNEILALCKSLALERLAIHRPNAGSCSLYVVFEGSKFDRRIFQFFEQRGAIVHVRWITRGRNPSAIVRLDNASIAAGLCERLSKLEILGQTLSVSQTADFQSLSFFEQSLLGLPEEKSLWSLYPDYSMPIGYFRKVSSGTIAVCDINTTHNGPYSRYTSGRFILANGESTSWCDNANVSDKRCVVTFGSISSVSLVRQKNGELKSITNKKDFKPSREDRDGFESMLKEAGVHFNKVDWTLK
jgi:hypothetical protein